MTSDALAQRLIELDAVRRFLSRHPELEDATRVLRKEESALAPLAVTETSGSLDVVAIVKAALGDRPDVSWVPDAELDDSDPTATWVCIGEPTLEITASSERVWVHSYWERQFLGELGYAETPSGLYRIVQEWAANYDHFLASH